MVDIMFYDIATGHSEVLKANVEHDEAVRWIRCAMERDHSTNTVIYEREVACPGHAGTSSVVNVGLVR